MSEKDQHRIIVDQPGMTSVVTKEYLQIWGSDTMIAKRFFKYWTFSILLVSWIATWIITRFIYIDLLLIEWHLLNLWILIPYATIGAGSLYIWNRYRKKPLTNEDKVRLNRMRELAEEGKL